MDTITHFSWGQITTNKDYTHKDCIIRNGHGSTGWDWTLDGTRHNPGITVKAVSRLAGCDIIILSTGMDDVLKVTDEAIQSLIRSGATFYVQNSLSAVQTYNRLAQEGEAVGMLLHSTC